LEYSRLGREKLRLESRMKAALRLMHEAIHIPSVSIRFSTISLLRAASSSK
jgi:hypothetical protein